jgi:hypothetical protein
MNRYAHFVFCSLIAFAAGACSHDHGATTTTDTNSDVIYENEATDEALVELQARAVDASKTIKITSPSAGQALASTASFTWNEPTARRGISDFFLGTAHAHGTPVNGAAYFVTISNASTPNLVRVFTTARQYQPSADVWTKLAAAGPLTVKVVGAQFETDKIPTGGGAFASAPIMFTVAK